MGLSLLVKVGSPSASQTGEQFNIAKGRGVELYNRVTSNNPGDAALIILILTSAGLEADAVLIDKDTISELLSGATSEVANTNYSRIVLTDTDIVTFLPDDTNDLILLEAPDQTLTSIAVGDSWAKVVLSYDGDSTVGTDINLIPMTLHDFIISPDGSDITIPLSSGFLEES